MCVYLFVCPRALGSTLPAVHLCVFICLRVRAGGLLWGDAAAADGGHPQDPPHPLAPPAPAGLAAGPANPGGSETDSSVRGPEARRGGAGRAPAPGGRAAAEKLCTLRLPPPPAAVWAAGRRNVARKGRQLRQEAAAGSDGGEGGLGVKRLDVAAGGAAKRREQLRPPCWSRCAGAPAAEGEKRAATRTEGRARRRLGTHTRPGAVSGHTEGLRKSTSLEQPPFSRACRSVCCGFRQRSRAATRGAVGGGTPRTALRARARAGRKSRPERRHLPGDGRGRLPPSRFARPYSPLFSHRARGTPAEAVNCSLSLGELKRRCIDSIEPTRRRRKE